MLILLLKSREPSVLFLCWIGSKGYRSYRRGVGLMKMECWLAMIGLSAILLYILCWKFILFCKCLKTNLLNILEPALPYYWNESVEQLLILLLLELCIEWCSVWILYLLKIKGNTLILPPPSYSLLTPSLLDLTCLSLAFWRKDKKLWLF